MEWIRGEQENKWIVRNAAHASFNRSSSHSLNAENYEEWAHSFSFENISDRNKVSFSISNISVWTQLDENKKKKKETAPRIEQQARG